MSYKPGHCCACGNQTWVTDALGRLVHPLSHLREGYLVFKIGAGESRLRLPVCEKCENHMNPENLTSVLQKLLDVGEALQFKGKAPDRYEEYEKHWKDNGRDVEGVWRRAPSVEGI